MKSRATILIAYDGQNPATYGVLRGSEKMLALKQKAIENICRIGGAKTSLMTCVAKGFNDGEMTDLLRYCHERREHIRGIYFMPLAQTWDPHEFRLEVERMTSEDIEMLLDHCFPGERMEFVPAGIMGNMETLLKCLRTKRPPFMGAHPNCESLYLLISNGREYEPVARYLKRPLPDVVADLMKLEERFAAKVRRIEGGLWGELLAKLGLKDSYLYLRALTAVALTLRRHVRVRRLLKGKGLGKAWHGASVLAGLAFGRKRSTLRQRHIAVEGALQLIVLPFEDSTVLETERLERCPNAFAWYDPKHDQVRTVPVCAWGLHKSRVMRAVSEHYASLAPLGARSGVRSSE